MNTVSVNGLQVRLESSGTVIVEDVAFEIAPGEIVGLVGETGSGKTTTGVALLGDVRAGAEISGGHIVIDGRDIAEMSAEELRDMRGRTVAYIPQDPATALNPAHRIGTQLRELFEFHEPGLAKSEVETRIADALVEVGLGPEMNVTQRFPHQLSGGQQQRVSIAMAFLLKPKLVVLDEPTTGLDVTTQARVLKIVKEMSSAHGVAALYVTHDLTVIANMATRLMVMYKGCIVESGAVEQVFTRPEHEYTRRLLSAVPTLMTAATRTETPVRAVTAAGPPVLTVENLSASYGRTPILSGISFSLNAGECLAVVGESGSGKSTLSRSIVGLHHQHAGTVKLGGAQLRPHARRRTRDQRREIQYIFQNPFSALNPRRTVRDSVGAPLDLLTSLSRSEKDARISSVLDRVQLRASIASEYPAQLSGGERQRVAIARALISRPRVLVCDEVTSALDVSVQQGVIRLLKELQEEEHLALVFVTHDLAVVSEIADTVMSLHQGSIDEIGTAAEVLLSPRAAYTRGLLADTPVLPTELVLDFRADSVGTEDLREGTAQIVS
ncbi:ABC transporter ATP-binding protein [Nocardia sp. NPDC059239]|uniref:ABC transporter ATP-binding protein n=1 Tax=unclassified Nocardia TaxID=2637762 RepID=UPI0036C85F64